jgi:DNA repair exonuclease SbcCD ATPase subunit
MPKAESYDDLIFQLGDLARDRLAGKPNCPRTMERVYRAEEALVARRDELAALEQEMNDEDAAWQDFLARYQTEREQHMAVVMKWKKAVDAVENQLKELRKRLASRKADLRYSKGALAKLEKKHADLELTTRDEHSLAVSRDNLKKVRLQQMRLTREVENLTYEVGQALTPHPGQPGAAGLIAHKQVLELDEQMEERKATFEQTMAEIDQAIADKETELQAAEDYLDQALFLLGEDVYAQRIHDSQLAPLYPRLDRAQ